MKITDLLKCVSIDTNAQVHSKEEAIDYLVQLMDNQGNLIDKEKYKEGIYDRESLSTTGIGEGIAIPHAQSDAVKTPGLAAMVVKDGVDYQSLDNQPAHLFFMIAVPKTGGNEHMQILAMLAQMLMDSDFKSELINAQSADDFMRIIDQKEESKIEEETQKQEDQDSFTGTYQIIAVTACPTGIAHTYMAAESLEEKAKEMNVSIKVETDGSGGAKNIPTQKEIEECQAIIVAADKNVEMARFDGKPVIQVRVAEGINKPEELIKKALSGDAPIYHAHQDTKQQEHTKKGILGTIYKHLMNGFSYMLPLVIAGGVFISLSLLLGKYSVNIETITLLNNIGQLAFQFMLPVLSGFIAMSIADRPGLAVGFIAGAVGYLSGTGFLGAVAAGFLSGYLLVGLRKILHYLPDVFEGIKPVLLYPVIGMFIAVLVIVFIFNTPLVSINQYIINLFHSMNVISKIILGIILGAMMAYDMGGPINKLAYLFATALVTSGQYDMMAAVMIGGMVPPITISLTTLLFKNRFTKKEQATTIRNFIMGLSFISEGAIPFVKSDAKHIIPACVIGSAVASAMSVYFGCTLMVPHGGIFVIGLVSNPMGYCISLCVGSIIGMLILAFLKKPIK